MKKKDFCIVFVCFLVFGLLMSFAIARYYRYENFFEIGKCYQWANPDPFKERDLVIKVLQVKDRYIQYVYIYPDGVSTPSSASVFIMSGYKECACE